MKKLITFILTTVLALSYTACNKDKNQDYNTLKINSGEHEGLTYTFSPNLGFWSPVNESVRMVDLIFGDEQMNLTGYENKMSILFYYDGTPQIQFPSPEGQSIQFGLNISGEVRTFNLVNAVLVIYRLDDFSFEGALSGEFVDQSNSASTIELTMEIRINMQEI